MRWLYYDPTNPIEAAERKGKIRSIDAWWKAFSQMAPTIRKVFSRKAEMDLPEFMHLHLGAVDPRLMWEFGRGVKRAGDRLVITPETNRQLRPLVRTLLERAPDLPDWEFFPYRLAEPLEAALPTVRARTGGDISGATVAVRRGPCNRVDLVFHHPNCMSPNDPQQSHDAFVAAESLLGEEMLDRWIGAIDVEPKKAGKFGKLFGRKPANLGVPLERLKETADALVGSIIDQIPEVPVRSWPSDLNDAGEPVFHMLELQPARRDDDYPGFSDLWLACVSRLELFKSILGSPVVDSGRFSRVGERFCYLKIDHAAVNDKEVVAFRATFEDALITELNASRLGASFGSGTGFSYSYIFLALEDVEVSFPVIRKVLRKVCIPHRTWLLFFDGELADEWIGIWDDTPPPPMSTDEA